MVLASRNGEESRNGKRSRGPSPNGHVQTDTSDDDNPVPTDKIRVGRDYQAVCPELTPENLRKPELLADRALLVWSPTADIPDFDLEEYIKLAKEKFGYNGEQALGMLFWHKHDLERAIMDLSNFTPFPDEWSIEDKVLFEQAFQFHGKSFHRIRQMLPEKTIASLVKYYYGWKKARQRTSQMDKQSRRGGTQQGDGVLSEHGSENEEVSDHDDKKWTIHRGIRRKSDTPPRSGTSDENGNQGEGGACSNCGVNCTVTNITPKGTLCTSCFLHWRRTGMLRPTSGPTAGKRGAPLGARHKREPPRGMYINHDDLTAMASGSTGIQMIKAMDRELESLHRQIQQNKQAISSLKRKHSETIDDVRADSNHASRINSRWTQEELLLCVQGVRKFGKDFQSISQVVGNKTEHHIRSFFVNYRKRFDLDKVLAEYEKEHGPVVEDLVEDEKIEIEDDSIENSSNDVICLSPLNIKKDLKSNKVV